MAADGMAIQVACKGLGVAESGFYEHRKRAPSERSIRHAMLTDLITQIHLESHGIYGGRRVHAELTLGRGVLVGHNQVQLLMRRAGLAGIAGRRRWKRILPDNIATDRVERQFNRAGPNQLWVTDITEHPTREGKVYCCVILDTYSRRVVGWSIDSSPTGALVTNALGMAIDSRLDKSSEPGTIIHSDQGVQFGSWAFTKRAKDSGLLASMGSIGDCYDNSMIESFWSRMQVELLDRKKWNTRLELANAIFEYLEIWHNRRRRHSQLGWLTPIEFERNRIITVA
ncbi:IS3 family transposase [Nocardioides sp. cx-169]|uniref:IS3 family transposase n=1 Tax=Nocardioides sp. cx-169 TaxID=2899080 RepID=UPI001E4A202A|nr:IS3 family transposase [Nocardioides sp. cx-169]MCD4536590.1 IS3 family transposase [Nocardioides sp. cx-169]